ncbi:MAG TPA: putative peptidoglycan glycosyltransferase FtsW [Tepidisphaeraceae bacterium]|jgi:cell division protein FtsW|nr:putative peptidoglycan glycosyltransferase FtsW [Tepidisphaeraceae bacterium]
MDVSIYRLRTRDVLTLCVMALLMLGVVMVQSASAGAVQSSAWQWTANAIKDAIFAIAGLATFLIVGCFNYAWLGRATKTLRRNPIIWLLVITALANLLVLVPHIGISVNGARRWLRLGPMQIQPSELAKWAVVLYLAYCLARRPLNVDRFFSGFIPVLIPIAGLCLLVVTQDFGTAILIALAALTMLLAGKVRLRYLVIVIPPVLAAGLWFVMHKEYRWKRITAFANPYAAPRREGYHMIQSLLSFSSGGWTGRGLGNGIQKLGYLPEDTTDFIFAVICEELGIFGAMLTIALYLGVLYCAWQTVKMKADNFGRLLAFGVGSMVALQALINIAVATVSVPTKGLSLPLVSAGGSGLIITCAALGLLRSVSRFKNPADETPATANEFRVPPATGRRPVHRVTDSLLSQFTTQ